jgi:hypothetical protein
MAAWFLAAHVVGVSFMCGLGWFVQVVHYPLFTFASGPRWTEFHAEHSRRTGWVVGVPWALQGFGALALLVWRPADLGLGLVLLAAALAGITVAATILGALPAHARPAYWWPWAWWCRWRDRHCTWLTVRMIDGIAGRVGPVLATSATNPVYWLCEDHTSS